MKITKLIESNNSQIFFKVAVGETGQAKKYSKALTKDIFNKISTSLKQIKVYLNIQANQENKYKTLSYEWLNIEDIQSSDDIQRELFIYASNMFRENKSVIKDNINVTIHIDKLPKSLSNLIVWQNTSNNQTSDNESDPF